MTQSTPDFASPPPQNAFYLLSFPAPHVLLVIFNRPRDLNCISMAHHWALDALFSWYDGEPALRCCIITGVGRAFSAGADLKEFNRGNQSRQKAGYSSSSSLGAGGDNEAILANRVMPASGFGALSRRTAGRKPIIGAINGLAYGGGTEITVNLDMAVMSKSATLGLPEVKRGIVAIAGALPRIVRTVGRPRAMEMALTGRVVSSSEALQWGLVNAVTEDHDVNAPVEQRPVVKKALELAKMICENSPDAVVVSKKGIEMGWEEGSAENGSRVLMEVWQRRLMEGANAAEGVRAFVEKRPPKWVASKL